MSLVLIWQILRRVLTERSLVIRLRSFRYLVVYPPLLITERLFAVDHILISRVLHNLFSLELLQLKLRMRLFPSLIRRLLRETVERHSSCSSTRVQLVANPDILLVRMQTLWRFNMSWMEMLKLSFLVSEVLKKQAWSSAYC